MSEQRLKMSQWGIDHVSTLVYLEIRAVDYGGKIDVRHMRCDGRIHPMYIHSAEGANIPTRLKDGKLLDFHDDWSCVEDFVDQKLISLHGKTVTFTYKGFEYAHEIRKLRASGKGYSEFCFYE
ncbi:MAG: hypothetical protein GY804_11490 [Alphaproteobacteria bacterium]|nr:hypothetical protein [Alphaproteobacteria bacterium]